MLENPQNSRKYLQKVENREFCEFCNIIYLQSLERSILRKYSHVNYLIQKFVFIHY